MCAKKNPIDWIAYLLLLVGGLNWGLVGAFQWNLVDAIVGSWPMVTRIVYALVGLSALWSLRGCGGCKTHCESKPAAM